MSNATELLRRALEALKDAKEEISDWGAYSSDYFQKKWDYEGSITQYDPLIEEIRDYLDAPRPFVRLTREELLYLGEEHVGPMSGGEIQLMLITQEALAEKNK